MSQTLTIGTKADGDPFTLPADLGDKKIAMLAQSKKGKTYGLGDILEELAKAQRPFIATDPANNLWGLRVLPDGRPSGLKVVVIGGDHADIPFEKDAGERMAEALLATPICAVIDVAFESKNSVRRFMIDFAGRLMRSKPEIPRVIVLEEAPVLIPQNAFGVQAQVCKDAVAALATIGGNFNYGVIPACQRAAMLDKNVLSQCEGLIVMGMTHKKDRETVRDWMEAKDIGDRAAAAFAELGSLPPGHAWYWNPGEDRFERFVFRKRETLHPREMQKLGLKASAVQLGDMQAFVDKMNSDLTKTTAAVSTVPKNPKKRTQLAAAMKETPRNRKLERDLEGQIQESSRMAARIKNLEETVERQRRENASLRREVVDANRRLEFVRAHLRPEYEALKKLYGEIGDAPSRAANGEIGDAWTPWLAKAAKVGARTTLEVLIKHGRLRQVQLATLAGIKYGAGHWRRVRAFITQNSLGRIEGDEIEAAVL